ncbi:MAG: thiamine-phosphate pyrophosphorylase [Candidatus Omnitrophica bacterium]|nr:thiamine-phosphate pyrophosphorylase [Candidatus Omnitrophota bacterium]
MKNRSLRLIDANFNRVKEGLRVCEDILRFIYDDARLTRSFKELRHDCSKIILKFPVPYRVLVKMREARKDVGKNSLISEKKKPNWNDVLASNMKRAQEGLRVLEEASKIIARGASRRFQSLRFSLYELEKRVLKKF